MTRVVGVLLAALAVSAALGAAPAPVAASPRQESILMDDAQFVYADAQHVDQRMAEAKALGFDRVRVSVYWNLLAPTPDKEQKPTGDASDPRWYGDRWARYDRIARLAAAHGVGVLFTLTGPSPLWATGTPEHGRSDVADTWNPNAKDFGEFVAAVAKRYSGSWQDEQSAPSTLPFLPPTITRDPPLPRVDHWSIWNEPNHGGWLTPQWDGSPLVPQSPRIYRGLVDAAWSALQGNGHAGDTVLLGETSPAGLDPGLTRGLHPLRFIRELYCLDRKLHPYRGRSAARRGCPAHPARFAATHPGLFGASGWAHHPYSLTTAPRTRDKNPDDATLSGTARLARTLDRATKAYRHARKFPIWLTEYGYQTDPPDPTIGVSFGRQAAWLDDATYVAYSNSRIASMAQFLLVDDGPIAGYKPNDPRYWGTFQSGLITLKGKHKTAYESFKRPISVRRHGRGLRVFGQLRGHGGATAELQRGGKTIAHAAGNARGFVVFKLRRAARGSYRIAWPSFGVSRSVRLSRAR